MKKNSTLKLKIILTAIGVLLVAFLAFVLIRSGGDLSIEGLKTALNFRKTPFSGATEFYYDAGSGSYAELDGGLVVVSNTVMQVLDKNGNMVVNEAVNLSNPTVYEAGDRAVVYDTGGKFLRVLSLSGELWRITAENPIVSASLNSNGWLAVTTQETGFSGTITVYNSVGRAVYIWNSGDSYILSATISPDNKGMTAIALTPDGSRITSISLSSEDEVARCELDGAVVFDVKYRDNKKVYAISSDSVLFLDGNCNITEEFSFDGRSLGAYTLEGSGFIAVFLNGTAGTGGELVVLDSGARELSRLEFETELSALDARGSYIAALGGERVYMLTKSLETEKQFSGTAAYTNVFMRKDNAITAVAPYSAVVLVESDSEES